MRQYKLENAPIVYYVSAGGHAQWVLFLHAAFVNHDMFRTQVADLGERYNVLTLDVIGHGNSTRTQKGDGIDKMAEWIREILRREKIDNIHIVGISLGAVLAQDFANRFPEAVASLACFGGYDINRFDARLQRKNRGAQALMMLRALCSMKWFAKANGKLSAYTRQAQEEFYAMNAAFPKRSFRYLASLNTMVNAHQTAPRGYPLLIGCGQYDIPMERAAIEMWKEHEPECSVVIFQGAGHCVNLDVPQPFNRTLERFWRGEAL